MKKSISDRTSPGFTRFMSSSVHAPGRQCGGTSYEHYEEVSNLSLARREWLFSK